ncbi:DUF2849 domain-containing protein [Devosia sp.]
MEILVGNELTSGAAVYLDAHDNWVEDFYAARLFAKEEAELRDAAIASSKATGRILGIEIEAVTVKDGERVADRMREKIRAKGPTTKSIFDGEVFDRQHLNEDGHVSI